MTIQELQKFFTNSTFSDETKSKIAKILEGQETASFEMFSEIKDLMQAELDSDFKKAGVDISNDPEAKKIQAEYEKTLDEIETDLNKDMSFVESELNELEEIRKQIVKAEDEMKVEDIKASM